MRYIMQNGFNYWLEVARFESIINFKSVQSASHCEFDGISFQFDSRFMDKKRFVAIAAEQ